MTEIHRRKYFHFVDKKGSQFCKNQHLLKIIKCIFSISWKK